MTGRWCCVLGKSVRVKRILLLVLLFATLLLAVAAISAVPNLPEATGYVNDFASVLSSSEREKLERQISDGVKKTGAEVAVAIVRTSGQYSPKEYAVSLFEKWGIGKKGKDNGLLILLVMDQRRLEIEVGYGLEPVITDSVAGRIRDQYLIPAFKQGKYALGLEQAISDIYRRIGSGSTDSPDAAAPARPNFLSLFPIIVVVLLTLVATVTLVLAYARKRQRCPQCGAPLRRTERILRTATAALPGLMAVTLLCNKCGYSKTVEKIIHLVGTSGPWSSGPGGPWLGGPWLGGGFSRRSGSGQGSGGGFGGFGGGRSGGGGAGGHW